MNILPNNPSKTPNSINPFQKFCVTIGAIPTSYKTSLTYEEQLYWFCDFLENSVIPAIDNNAKALQEVQHLFVELKKYVEDEFSELNLQKEVNNKIESLLADGTLENIINVQIFNELNNKVEKNTEQINKLKPFNFNGNFYLLKGVNTEVLYTLEEMQAKINKMKQAGMTKAMVTVEIKPPFAEMEEYTAGTRNFADLHFRMFPDNVTLQTYLDLLKENEIEPYYLKIHSTWLRNSTNASLTSKMDVYRQKVMEELPNIQERFEWYGICNEWADATTYENITSLLTFVKQYGKVVFSGVRQDYITDTLLNYVDGYCPHFYTSLSRMGEDTDLEFCVHNFKQSPWFQSLEKWNKRTTKPVIVGECGCPSYWASLWAPYSWNYVGELIENGAPQWLYIKTMFQCLKKYNIIELNYWWELYDLAINLINEYQEGKYYE